jgi:hypothetical protein
MRRKGMMMPEWAYLASIALVKMFALFWVVCAVMVVLMGNDDV